MRYLSNVPIITNYGTFTYRQVSLDDAVAFLRSEDWTSAIGHEGTADFLRMLSGVEIPVRRVTVNMEKGDVALVLRMLKRVQEGAVFRTIEDIQKWPHEFGMLERTE